MHKRIVPFSPCAAQTHNIRVIIVNAFTGDTTKILLKTGKKVLNKNN
jgi:hypothetical protein